jgi:hypothetical protein
MSERTMGVTLMTSAPVNEESREKLSLQDLSPPPARIVPSAQGRWGWVQSLSTAIEKNFRSRTYTPRGRRGTGLRQKDDGVGDHHGAQVEMPAAEKFSLQVLYPRAPPGAGRKQDSGERTMGSKCRQPKKLSLQDLYPPRRRGTGLR